MVGHAGKLACLFIVYEEQQIIQLRIHSKTYKGNGIFADNF